jgi:FkbM family methyltransferase
MDIKEFIRKLDIKVFVEIGAHFAIDTVDFRKMHPQARIVCFEPDPRNIQIIKKLGRDKICELHELALSDTNEPREFFLSSGKYSGELEDQFTTELLKDNDWSCSSSLKKPTGHLQLHRWVSFPKSTTVQCCRLDDFEPLKNTKIDFIWADVQGAEDLVFSGGSNTLKNTRYVFTEYCNHQLYEGQINLKQIVGLFGPDWKILHIIGEDVLLENINFNKD